VQVKLLDFNQLHVFLINLDLIKEVFIKKAV